MTRRYASEDMAAMDLLPLCPHCFELCNGDHTACPDCGTNLMVRAATGRPFIKEGK